MAGMDERAREKKSVGRGGSSLRKLFPLGRGLGSSSPVMADAICVSLWTGSFWLSMAGHADVGRLERNVQPFRVTLPLCGSSA
jgi:hypothetical protein